jgi:ribonuclease D
VPPLVTTPAGVDEVVERLLAADRYALDTEFHRERTYWPHLALVQVAWPAGGLGPAGVALIDPMAVDVAPLAEVLAGPGTMVAHAAEQDLEVLERACGRGPTRLFDTQIAAGFAGHGSSGLSTLSQHFLGVSVAKGDRLTDWRRRPLTESQLAYAAADVDRLLDLADAITAVVEGDGRLAWAEEECLGLLQRPHGGADPLRAWWKLRDARQLRGGARGVAQELAAWRERRARTLDQPVRSILPDLAVQAIVHRPPRTVAALGQVRGLDGRHLRSDVAAEILAAVEAGLALSSSALTLPPADDVAKEQRAAMSLLMAWVAQRAKDERIDPAVLATRTDLAAYLRGDADARLASGWRATMVAEPVRALVEGRAVLAFDGVGRLALEERSRRPYLGPSTADGGGAASPAPLDPAWVAGPPSG